MSDPIGEYEYDPAVEIAEEEIAKYIDVAYRTFCAGIGDLGDEPAQKKAADQMRHLHLAEPWLPAQAIIKRLREAGLSPVAAGWVEGPQK